MQKQTITYTDYNGVERTEDFYFHLSQAELVEMEAKYGGFKETLNRIIKADDVKTLMEIFKDLILQSYGEKSTDGRRFVKTKELSDAFAQTEAYSNLFIQLITDADAASTFANGLIASIQKQAAQPVLLPLA